METKDITNDLKNLVIDNGDDVGIDEPVCVLYRADHDNCYGCPSELGCDKYLALVSTIQTMDRIMRAKSHEEIKGIIL